MNANGTTKNLRRLTSDEARTIGKAGGIASGRIRRERKLLRDELLDLLRTGNTQREICTALIAKALDGDIRAFQTIRDTVDGKPVDVMQLGSSADKDVHFTFTVVDGDTKTPAPSEWAE